MTTSPFNEFDPLKARGNVETEVAAQATKREINNILNSYVGWYDPFCELVQNALDSVEKRAQSEEGNYTPHVRVVVNLQDNQLTVSDNGTGLSQRQFETFLAPNISYKSGKTRGHKGVGATYVAYGFNYVQISTKTADFSAVGKMEGARRWLTDPTPEGNPQVRFDPNGTIDKYFHDFDQGVSVTVRFDKESHPRDINWIKATSAKVWHKLLSIKTGLGAFQANPNIQLSLEVVKKSGEIDKLAHTGIKYFWPHEQVTKTASLKAIRKKSDELYRKKGKDYTLPSSMRKLDAFYGRLDSEELANEIQLEDDEVAICEKFTPSVYFSYMYSAKVWDKLNASMELRARYKAIAGGIQIAADNMPQGELIQIPLRKNIGRQHQAHFVIHFDKCRADLGRKGFRKDIVEFAKSVCKKLMDGPLNKHRSEVLRVTTGSDSDLMREEKVEGWKKEIEEHERNNPINLISEHFFHPQKRISITSTPTREQDVIALFNQLLAGGVIRGVRIMSTNERFTYDGMYRVVFQPPLKNHLYDKKANPLGIIEPHETVESYLKEGKTYSTSPRILEYKYCLNGLIEDFSDGTKNPKDIDLCVVWNTGEDFREQYQITSLLDEDNIGDRQFHGITHIVTSLSIQGRVMDLVVLEELIQYLNNPDETTALQKKKYEED